MHYDLSILFFIKKSKKDKSGNAPIYCRITVNGGRAEISTNEKVEPAKWDSAMQRVKGRLEPIRVINNVLDHTDLKIKRIFNSLQEKEQEISAGIIKDIIIGKSKSHRYLIETFELNNQLMEKEKDLKYSADTVKRYKISISRIAAFLRKEYSVPDIQLQKLNLTFIRKYDIFLRTEYSTEHNTAMKYLKHLKKVIHFAMELGYIERDPFLRYKTAYKEVNRGYLTTEELKRIEEKKFRIKRLDQVRDVFIFVCYTGLSYSDLKKTTSVNISKGIDGKNWIIYERVKTGVRASIPLLPAAQAILDKYKNDPECGADGILLPIKSNQKLNSYLSEIAELCEIDKHVTMHLGRHTFATTVTLSQGIPIETVQKMLGHKNLSTTSIYAKVVDKKVSEDMTKLLNKMSG